MADGGESKTKIIFDDATVVKQKLADKGSVALAKLGTKDVGKCVFCVANEETCIGMVSVNPLTAGLTVPVCLRCLSSIVKSAIEVVHS